MLILKRKLFKNFKVVKSKISFVESQSFSLILLFKNIRVLITKQIIF